MSNCYFFTVTVNAKSLCISQVFVEDCIVESANHLRHILPFSPRAQVINKSIPTCPYSPPSDEGSGQSSQIAVSWSTKIIQLWSNQITIVTPICCKISDETIPKTIIYSNRNDDQYPFIFILWILRLKLIYFLEFLPPDIIYLL